MNTPLHLELIVPDVRAGAFTPGDVIGIRLADVLLLSGVLAGEPTSVPEGRRFPLAIPDGGEVALPLPLPLIGEVEFIVGNDGGRLRLVIPQVPFLLGTVQNAVKPWMVGGPSLTKGGTALWLRLKPGQQASWSMGMLGKLSVMII